MDEFFFHKVGNYLNEGIDQIIYDKSQSIQDNKYKYKYCLWGFAANAVNAETAFTVEKGQSIIQIHMCCFLSTPSK